MASDDPTAQFDWEVERGLNLRIMQQSLTEKAGENIKI